ncbi:hypothetical protein ACJX0J_007922, partial [Zea mays]
GGFLPGTDAKLPYCGTRYLSKNNIITIFLDFNLGTAKTILQWGRVVSGATVVNNDDFRKNTMLKTDKPIRKHSTTVSNNSIMHVKNSVKEKTHNITMKYRVLVVWFWLIHDFECGKQTQRHIMSNHIHIHHLWGIHLLMNMQK